VIHIYIYIYIYIFNILFAFRSYFGLVNILKAKNINRKYKVITCKTLIKPVLMFGAETWVLSKADELRLGVFERKILRRIYGPICEGAAWRSRYNEELYRLYDKIDLVTTIRMTRLRWAGHIVRMQDNLPCKKITLDKPEGRRRVGRPDLRWMDRVMRDAKRLGVRNWKSKAKDRDGWRQLLESAKTLHGLWCLGVSLHLVGIKEVNDCKNAWRESFKIGESCFEVTLCARYRAYET